VIDRFPGETPGLSLVWAVLESPAADGAGSHRGPWPRSNGCGVASQRARSIVNDRGGDRSLGSRQAGLRPNDFTRTMGRHPAEYGRRLRGMAAHGAVTARRGSIARLEQGFRTQTMASRRERTEDSPTRWRFRPPSPGTFRLQPCGGPRTASGPGFNLIALRGRRSRNGRPSLRPGARVRRARLSLFAEISERRPCASSPLSTACGRDPSNQATGLWCSRARMSQTE
jgi:hypothetical protein